MKGRTSQSSNGLCLGLRPKASACRAFPYSSSSRSPPPPSLPTYYYLGLCALLSFPDFHDIPTPTQLPDPTRALLALWLVPWSLRI
uniref:KRR1 small subunit processome component KRR-R motif-containing protein 1 n=1 Tax=Rhizophora mucronata TaxID=61149 RepID=A0A2P2KP12_RHIMU